MKILTPLIHSLKPGEVQLVRTYYKMQITNEVVKRHLLFDLIKNNQVKTDEDACRIIYNKKPHAAFSQLKTRLKNDILNMLLLQDSSSRFVTPFAQAEFDARRHIITGDILISRGISNEGEKVLLKAEKIADEFELYSEVALANDILLSHLSVKRGIKEYERIQKKINQSIDKLQRLIKSKDYYHKILVPNLFNLKNEKDQIEFAKKAITELGNDYNISQSARVGYYYYYISIFYFNLKKDYNKALSAADEFLNLILNNKAINSKRAIASAHLQIGFISLQLSDYKLAMKNTENALKNFKAGLINELTTLEVLFLACFYDNDWLRAHDILQRALQHPKLHSNEFLPAKWHYYKTCLLFKEKKFEAATHALNDCSHLLDDRTGWLYGYKIMDILLAFENDTEFLIDNKVANFRKILRKQNGVSIERPKLILKILETLVRKRYDFKEVAKIQKHFLALLDETKTDYAWEPMGYELVKFNEWFNSKMQRRAAAKTA
jgi:tetratricopeptide (TPR) repeat protein